MVSEVATPAGAGAPRFENVVIDPASSVPLTINLLVANTDTGSWDALSPAEQERYAGGILAAVAARYPTVAAARPSQSAYYMVRIWEQFPVENLADAIDADGLGCGTRRALDDELECRAVATTAMLEVPLDRSRSLTRGR